MVSVRPCRMVQRRSHQSRNSARISSPNNTSPISNTVAHSIFVKAGLRRQSGASLLIERERGALYSEGSDWAQTC